MEKIKDKVVLVVGGTGTIGRYTAKLLQSSGADVYITGRDENKLKEAADFASVPPQRAFVADITKPRDLQYIASVIPPVDILINAAGIGIIKNFEDLTAEEFERTISVNLT
ncbi:MAG: SDR family NAD(P)-dependent oxidoreductase, partial [Chitinophagales bacterium]|nr:SDR family NAD(P)-dependent oxidoreductase [Chitinophagales bacterium]